MGELGFSQIIHPTDGLLVVEGKRETKARAPKGVSPTPGCLSHVVPTSRCVSGLPTKEHWCLRTPRLCSRGSWKVWKWWVKAEESRARRLQQPGVCLLPATEVLTTPQEQLKPCSQAVAFSRLLNTKYKGSIKDARWVWRAPPGPVPCTNHFKNLVLPSPGAAGLSNGTLQTPSPFIPKLAPQLSSYKRRIITLQENHKD